MILFKRKSDLQDYLSIQKARRKTIGFVPTMGALHLGHISLIESSRNDDSITICSIFVNPTQFNDPGDFKKYPITLERDIYLLESAKCDVLFLPGVEQVYPEGAGFSAKYDLGYLENVLEGKYRPGHFQGVCMVVHRLLDIVRPDNLYLGQKDYQQCMVISRLIDLIGQPGIRVNICPTLRESDGLAMSSRNLRLSPAEREQASWIYRILLSVKENLKPGDLSMLKNEALKKLKEKGFNPDYLEIADATSLQIPNNWDGRQKLVVLTAAFLHEVRLIDNMLLN